GSPPVGAEHSGRWATLPNPARQPSGRPPSPRGSGCYHGVMALGSPSFSDEESALILQRAAELQERRLSLTELEAAAAEAGIDAALVRRAAHEVSTLGPPPTPPAPARAGALGAPLQLVHERVVPGEGDG